MSILIIYQPLETWFPKHETRSRPENGSRTGYCVDVKHL